MSVSNQKDAEESLLQSALKSVTEDWREALRLSNDERLPKDTRSLYRRIASEFHEEMVRLGHKHNYSPVQST